MSMLTRMKRGSLRGSRRSRRSVKSVSSCASDSLRVKYTENDSTLELGACERYDETQVRTLIDVILSFDNERELVTPSLEWKNDIIPPDYGAFMYEVREADKDSDNILEFCCKTSNIICNSLLVTVFVGLSIFIPVTMVSIGIKYLDSCPKEPRIPIYLLVGGFFGLIKLLSTLWRNIQTHRYEDTDLVFDDRTTDGAFANKTYRTLDTLLSIFLLSGQLLVLTGH